MLKIDKMFFCDDIQEGQFFKVNVTGMNRSSVIAINNMPYKLLNYLVITGESDEPFDNLKLEIVFRDEKGKITNKILNDLPKDTDKYEQSLPIFFCLKSELNFANYGKMDISILRDSTVIYQESFKIVSGESPNLKVATHLPQAKIFTGNDEADEKFVINLLGTATKSLKILDTYIEDDDSTKAMNILNLLSKVISSVKIQILTSEKNKEIIDSDNNFKQAFPNAEVKSAKRYHDRFVIINDSEYYHFGHSLKDIANRKISRFSKINDLNEITKLNETFNTIWNQF